MKTFIIITLSLITAVTAFAQKVPVFTGSKVTQDDAQKALDFHNLARAEVGVTGLKWSVELAEYAQQWANYLANNNGCNIEHRSRLGEKTRKDTGENIYFYSGSNSGAIDASKSWYSEISQYTYRTLTHQNFYATGHYTQMIWKNTKYVGIGMAICPSGATIIVANYSPAGNYIGEKPY